MHGLQRQGIGFQTLGIQVVDQLLLGGLTARQELHRTVTMGTDTLTAPDQGLDLGVMEYGMELGGIEGFGHRGDLGIEKGLGLGHQPTQSFGITGGHALDGLVDQSEVLLTQSVVLGLFLRIRREGIGLVQVGENAYRVFLGTEVGKYPVEVLLHIQRTNLNLVAIEGHQVGLHTKGTGLVQTTATARRAQLAQIGDVHLTQRVQIQMI